ncbi:2,4-dihydroxyhept-2-ene-1,7-dioic acid aldolase [Deinococcus peraridilitoris]|uniref:4-hydroxy-tetrahydrodipicolinate synthase n=1 Tax=Deinococcus peraridilitoris (strain DSM 19664 / LMG 22246 / CIP 109416 / KR-200) TaxID=937777 RepID=K9ZZ18_DEIPD|nr:2,4-dihydroxyhept-2-ene-1,7-dioic acid aldolase [Deinococcus peraridilitoris]AFZ66449.1 dihydrodipicolinate synthase [Deinococcus peraridilitoris DSM 19664]
MLQGSITPLVTPFKNGRIDEAALERLIERQISAGSHGVSVGGTTGEPGTLSVQERKDLIALASRIVSGRVPLLAGTGTLRLDETLEITRFAADLGVAGALVITPYYIKPNQAGLVDFFGKVAASVPELPVVLYNIPGRSGVEIRIDTVAKVREAHPNVVGLKHSSKDVEYVSDLLRAVGRDFKVFCGLEALTFPMMAVGGVGTIAATANWLPRETAELCQLTLDGKYREALEVHFRLLEANDAIFWDTNPIPLKTVLSWMGLCEKEWREPLGPTTPDIEARLRKMAQSCGLLQGELA